MPRIKIVTSGSKAAFAPANMVIPVNQKVFWLNEDAEDHQISLTGEILKHGDTSSEVVITDNRTYFCMLHAGETGNITIGTLAAFRPKLTAKPKQTAKRKRTVKRKRTAKAKGRA